MWAVVSTRMHPVYRSRTAPSVVVHSACRSAPRSDATCEERCEGVCDVTGSVTLRKYSEKVLASSAVSILATGNRLYRSQAGRASHPSRGYDHACTRAAFHQCTLSWCLRETIQSQPERARTQTTLPGSMRHGVRRHGVLLLCIQWPFLKHGRYSQPPDRLRK